MKRLTGISRVIGALMILALLVLIGIGMVCDLGWTKVAWLIGGAVTFVAYMGTALWLVLRRPKR